MNCPLDGSTLVLSERHGIEIDYCPQCRGVWLDRGELDKIIERADSASYGSQGGRGRTGDYGGYGDGHHGSGHDQYGKRRRGGWLGELFD
jgi:Zn-finger nucleic acid-binding protein